MQMLVCLMFSLKSLRLSSFIKKNHLFNFGCAGFLLLWLWRGVAFLWLWRLGTALQLQCKGFSVWWLLLLQSIGSRACGSVVVASWIQSTGSTVVAHGLSCCAACGMFHQGSDPCLLQWQADSLPLSHQGSPWRYLKVSSFLKFFFHIWTTSSVFFHLAIYSSAPFGSSLYFLFVKILTVAI